MKIINLAFLTVVLVSGLSTAAVAERYIIMDVPLERNYQNSTFTLSGNMLGPIKLIGSNSTLDCQGYKILDKIHLGGDLYLVSRHFSSSLPAVDIAANNATIKSCIIEGNFPRGINIEASIRPNGTSTIQGTTIDDTVVAVTGDNVYVKNSVNVYMAGNLITGGQTGIFVLNSRTVNIDDNRIIANAGEGVLIRGGADIGLWVNHINNNGKNGVFADRVIEDIRIWSNAINSNTQNGIKVFSPQATTDIDGNWIAGHGSASGIFVDGLSVTSGVTKIINSTTIKNNRYGIYFTSFPSGTNITVSNNTVFDNSVRNYVGVTANYNTN